LPLDKIKKCIGDPDANVENEVLKAEQALQVLALFLNASIFDRLFKPIH